MRQQYTVTHASSSAAQHSTAGRAVQTPARLRRNLVASSTDRRRARVDRIGRIDRIDVGRVSRENRT